MTIDELNAKQEAKFKEKTGMTVYEWVLHKYKTITPFELMKAYEVATEDEETLVKDLQDLGLGNEVINALLEYVFVFNGKGFDESLILEMGGSWAANDIFSVEKAIKFMKEQDKKKIKGSSGRWV